MQRPAERLGELEVPHRVGGDRVHRAADRGRVGRVHVEPGQVGDVDPGHPLPAVAQRAAAAELERREHLGQRPAAGAEHDARPRRHHPHAGLLGRGRLPLPVDADLRQEVVGRRGRLGECLVAAVAVVADRGRRDEHGRFPRGLRDALHEVSGAYDATVADPVLLGRRPPPLRDRLAGEVEHGVDAVEGLGRRRSLERIPADDPLGEVADHGPSPVRVAGHHDRAVEQSQEPRSDESGRTGDERLHGVLRMGVGRRAGPPRKVDCPGTTRKYKHRSRNRPPHFRAPRHGDAAAPSRRSPCPATRCCSASCPAAPSAAICG
jgi:hypothetical protein